MRWIYPSAIAFNRLSGGEGRADPGVGLRERKGGIRLPGGGDGASATGETRLTLRAVTPGEALVFGMD
jgi:hypothetical protein